MQSIQVDNWFTTTYFKLFITNLFCYPFLKLNEYLLMVNGFHWYSTPLLELSPNYFKLLITAMQGAQYLPTSCSRRLQHVNRQGMEPVTFWLRHDPFIQPGHSQPELRINDYLNKICWLEAVQGLMSKSGSVSTS